MSKLLLCKNIKWSTKKISISILPIWLVTAEFSAIHFYFASRKRNWNEDHLCLLPSLVLGDCKTPVTANLNRKLHNKYITRKLVHRWKADSSLEQHKTSTASFTVSVLTKTHTNYTHSQVFHNNKHASQRAQGKLFMCCNQAWWISSAPDAYSFLMHCRVSSFVLAYILVRVKLELLQG